MSVKTTTSTPAEEAWDLLQALIFDVQRPRFLALCSEFELTPPQLMTLRWLGVDQPMTMSEVARRLACDASNVTGIVDRLEARGLVERRAAPGDRRVKIVGLTEAGASLKQEIRRRKTAVPEQLAALPEADQRALRDILRRAFGER
jgi:MarR family transcriptional regulator, organic hydroperoxide resistance regulator